MSNPVYLGISLKGRNAAKVNAALLTDDLEVLFCDEIILDALGKLLNEYPRVTAAIDLPARRGRPSTSESSSQMLEIDARDGASSTIQAKLVDLNFSSQPGSPRQNMLCRSATFFQQILCCLPFAARTLEGRLQRQLILVEQGLQLPDPFYFFEEITRHHLLTSNLPLETIHSAVELNALAAATFAHDYASQLTKNIQKV